MQFPLFYLMHWLFSFDNHVGHDYLLDYEEGMNLTTAKKIESHSTWTISTRLRKVVFLIKHSTSLLLALVSASLCLCVIWLLLSLLQDKNVLYITMEMAEEKIAERIDANFLNVNIQEIGELPKQNV